MAPREFVSMPELFTHSQRASVTRLGGSDTSHCVCVRCSVIEDELFTPCFSMVVIPAHRGCKSACVFVCAQLHICVAAGRTHLSDFLSAVLSIIPSIWQPKPVKKTFLLATAFKGSDTGDSQPQEPHIFMHIEDFLCNRTTSTSLSLSL